MARNADVSPDAQLTGSYITRHGTVIRIPLLLVWFLTVNLKLFQLLQGCAAAARQQSSGNHTAVDNRITMTVS
jgi:hypothetical protein